MTTIFYSILSTSFKMLVKDGNLKSTFYLNRQNWYLIYSLCFYSMDNCSWNCVNCALTKIFLSLPKLYIFERRNIYESIESIWLFILLEDSCHLKQKWNKMKTLVILYLMIFNFFFKVLCDFLDLSSNFNQFFIVQLFHFFIFGFPLKLFRFVFDIFYN